MGSIVPPPKDVLRSEPHVAGDVTSLGNRVCAEVIELRFGH